MMNTAVAARSNVTGWLRNPDFDIVLICGLTALALFAGLVIAYAPGTLGVILLADNWLLGYPHVIATFTGFAPIASLSSFFRFWSLPQPPHWRSASA